MAPQWFPELRATIQTLKAYEKTFKYKRKEIITIIQIIKHENESCISVFTVNYLETKHNIKIQGIYAIILF